jgi:hypothetical protein
MSSVQTGTGRKERGRKPPVLPGTYVLYYIISQGHTPEKKSQKFFTTVDILNTFDLLQINIQIEQSNCQVKILTECLLLLKPVINHTETTRHAKDVQFVSRVSIKREII